MPRIVTRRIVTRRIVVCRIVALRVGALRIGALSDDFLMTSRTHLASCRGSDSEKRYGGLDGPSAIATIPRPQQRVKLTFGARSLAFWVASKEEACELFDEAYSQQRCAKLRFRAVGTVGR